MCVCISIFVLSTCSNPSQCFLFLFFVQVTQYEFAKNLCTTGKATGGTIPCLSHFSVSVLYPNLFMNYPMAGYGYRSIFTPQCQIYRPRPWSFGCISGILRSPCSGGASQGRMVSRLIFLHRIPLNSNHAKRMINDLRPIVWVEKQDGASLCITPGAEVIINQCTFVSK